MSKKIEGAVMISVQTAQSARVIKDLLEKHRAIVVVNQKTGEHEFVIIPARSVTATVEIGGGDE